MYQCVYFHNNMLLKTHQTATFTLTIICSDRLTLEPVRVNLGRVYI